MKLNTPEIWEAFDNKDPSYDGKFFVAVKSTKIFCRPSCTARKPLHKNVDFFRSAQECLERGFRVCKRCRPDLLFYKPTIELVNQAKVVVEEEYLDKEKLLVKLKELGVTENHLSKLFSMQFGLTPLQYRTKLCLLKAKDMLLESEQTVTQIAYNCGFLSIASFYRAFQKEFNMSPKQVRGEEGKE